MHVGLSLIFALGFAVIHFSSKHLTFVKEIPRSKILSAAGGVAVSYVFLHLLPDLNRYQNKVENTLNSGIGKYIENHIYVISLLGLAIFYGLERMVKKSNKSQTGKSKKSLGVFWVHISSFFVYNATIGYILIREEFKSNWGMFFYFLALGIHFVTVDRGLRREHKQIYDKYGRIILTVAIMFGWLIGVFYEVNDLIISVLVAFLVGGLILNVMKEELPEEKESSFVAFISGLVVYSFILMLIN
jgi:hypothetical protein